MSNTKLKTTFNTASTLYEEIRPGYPEKLIEDIVGTSLVIENTIAGFLRLDAAPEKRRDPLRNADTN